MSYARFGDRSDVYVFLSVGGYLECCGCSLRGYSRSFATTAKMIEHLEEHRLAGHQVPEGCVDELRTDAEENDAWIAAGAPEDWEWKDESARSVTAGSADASG